MSQKHTHVIIDGEVIVMSHFSGIGHYALEMLKAIDRKLDNDSSVSFSILVNYRHIHKVQNFGFRNINIIKSPFSLRISNGLKNHNLQPPLDLFFGKGIYVFPNYSSWPLLFSKNITFIYDVSYEIYPEFVEPRNQIFLKEQVKKSAKRADVVATISESSKQDILNLYNLDKKNVEIFYPAVDKVNFLHRSTDEISRVKNKYKIKGSYILFVGNIEPRKNLKNLLLAYEKLSKALREKYSLLIIGAKGWQDKEILEIITRLRKQNMSIQFPSKYVTDTDLPTIYSGAKIFVYPSIYEGFGIPPIEAMACGTPVISSNNSSLPEAVGEAALMVDDQSIDDISDKISELLNNKKLQKLLIKKGYEQLEKFSWDNSAKKLLLVIKKLH